MYCHTFNHIQSDCLHLFFQVKLSLVDSIKLWFLVIILMNMSSNESNHFLDSNFQTINNNTHYQCHLCQQHFLFQSEFKMHLKEHGQQVNFICPQCQLSGRFFKECGGSGQWIKSIRGHSKTMLIRFCPLLTTYLPLVNIWNRISDLL